MDINWYPGHMAKTRRVILDTMKQVDIVIELVDARIPTASKNPDISEMIGNKAKILILNKSDLADPAENKKWAEYYRSLGYTVLLGNSRSKDDRKPVLNAIREAYREKAERDRKRGIVARTARVMILGIPNVGKSTFINNLCGARRAEAQDRPGVTQKKQWVPLAEGIDLLDTPGILWPKLENQSDAALLAITGAIKDTILDLEGLSVILLAMLHRYYPEQLKARYKLTELESKGYDLFLQIGRKRGFVVSGGEVDEERTAITLLDEFRGAKIGRISLERADEISLKQEPETEE